MTNFGDLSLPFLDIYLHIPFLVIGGYVMKFDSKLKNLCIFGLIITIFIQATNAQESGDVVGSSNQQGTSNFSVSLSAPKKLIQVRAMPTSPGEIYCYDIQNPIKKTICNYLPKDENALELQRIILNNIFGGRQPGDRLRSHIMVLSNGILQFAHDDPSVISQIQNEIAGYDVLDTFQVRRKVNLLVRIIELNENADSTLGILAQARYAGTKGNPVGAADRLNITNVLGTALSIKATMGNLVNNMLEVMLQSSEAEKKIKTLSYIPLYNITQGYYLNAMEPQRINMFIPVGSINVYPEALGVKLDGQVRLHQDASNMIKIKDFSVTYSQLLQEGQGQKDDIRFGPEVLKAGPMELDLEVGCSTAFRVIHTLKQTAAKEKRWFLGRQKETTESRKDFLFVVQALDEINSTQSACIQTKINLNQPAVQSNQ